MGDLQGQCECIHEELLEGRGCRACHSENWRIGVKVEGSWKLLVTGFVLAQRTYLGSTASTDAHANGGQMRLLEVQQVLSLDGCGMLQAIHLKNLVHRKAINMNQVLRANAVVLL